MATELPPYPETKASGVPWLGDVPAHWKTHKLRNIAEMRVSNVDKLTLEGEVPVRLCNYVDVYKHDRITDALPFMRVSATPDEIRNFRVAVGDVLITKDSESWNDIGVPALVEYAAPDLLCGYHLAILRPTTEISGAYLFRSLQCRLVAYQFHVRANGVTRYGLTHGAIKSVVVPLPPLDEQQAIVRYLDHIDRRIRRYIRAKQRLLALLHEQKQAIIHQAVTRGLDASAPLKPSGVAWLEEVPAHWEVVRIKWLLREVDARSTTGQETLLSMRMNHGLVPYDEHFSRPAQAATLVDYKIVRPGQIVMNRLQANNGLVFASTVTGLVSPDYAVFELTADVDLEFLATLFRSTRTKDKFRAESKGLGTGTSGFLRLYTDRFGMIPIALRQS